MNGDHVAAHDLFGDAVVRLIFRITRKHPLQGIGRQKAAALRPLEEEGTAVLLPECAITIENCEFEVKGEYRSQEIFGAF